MIVTEYGNEKYKIIIEGLTTEGKGLTLRITGGDSPHVGAVAMAIPSLNAATGEKTCDVSILTGPGHKDRLLAEKVADMVCRQTGEIVSATAGVHIDGASKEDLKLLCDNTIEAARLFLRRYLQ